MIVLTVFSAVIDDLVGSSADRTGVAVSPCLV